MRKHLWHLPNPIQWLEYQSGQSRGPSQRSRLVPPIHGEKTKRGNRPGLSPHHNGTESSNTTRRVSGRKRGYRKGGRQQSRLHRPCWKVGTRVRSRPQVGKARRVGQWSLLDLKHSAKKRIILRGATDFYLHRNRNSYTWHVKSASWVFSAASCRLKLWECW